MTKILSIFYKFAWKDYIEIIQNFDTKNIKDFKPVQKFKEWGPKWNYNI